MSKPTKMPKNLRLTFANEAFTLGATENAMPDTIAIPYGSYPHSYTLEDGKTVDVTQVFDRACATAIANELATAMTAKKTKGIPIYEGHPDVPGLASSYPNKAAIGWITAIVANEADMALSVRWLRNPGEGFAWHSPYWGGALTVTSANTATMKINKLVSLALTNNPNIKDFRLPNEEPDEPNPNQKEEDSMNEFMKKLAAILGLQDTATEDDITAAVSGAVAKAKDSPAQIATANEKATTERRERIALIVGRAVEEGRITGAEKPVWETRLANETNYTAEFAALNSLAPKLKLAPIADPNKKDPPAKTAGEQITMLANEAMKGGLSYTDAYAKVQREHPDLFDPKKS